MRFSNLQGLGRKRAGHDSGTRGGSGAVRERLAFTLIETLIATSLLAIVALASFAFLADLRGQRQLLVDLGDDLDAGSIFFERLERDLTTCVAFDPRLDISGVVGDASSLAITARRIWPDPDDPVAGLRGTVRTRYRFDSGERTLTLDVNGRVSVLSSRVEFVRFRYNDSRDPRVWRDAFDASADGGLPVAIEVGLWFTAPGQRPVRAADRTMNAGAMNAGIVSSPFERRSPADPGDGAAAMEQPPARAPDRLRIFAIPDAEPTGGRHAGGQG